MHSFSGDSKIAKVDNISAATIYF